jgi:hypothetical protein
MNENYSFFSHMVSAYFPPNFTRFICYRCFSSVPCTVLAAQFLSLLLSLFLYPYGCGILPQVTKSLRGNVYATRYPSNGPINRISMVTNNRNNSCIVANGVYTWVRLKTSTEIYGKTLNPMPGGITGPPCCWGI